MNVIVDTIIFLGKFLYYFLESLVYKIIPKNKKKVSGEIVLITGAGSGLGRLLAIHFAKLGAILVLWDINQEGNMETFRLVKETGDVKVFAYKCDCSNRQEVYRVAGQVSRWEFFTSMAQNRNPAHTFPNKEMHLPSASPDIHESLTRFYMLKIQHKNGHLAYRIRSLHSVIMYLG